MTRNRALFSTFAKLEEPMNITIGDGRIIKAVGRGNIDVELFNGRSWLCNTLIDVLHVPELGETNLFSIGATTDRGHKVILTKKIIKVLNGSRILLTGSRQNEDLYVLDIRVRHEHSALMATGSLRIWHERLAHVSVETVQQMANNGSVHGLRISDKDKFFCNGCVLGKMARKPFNDRETRSLVVGEVIHSDVCGPMEVPSLGNTRYCFVFKDEASAYRKVYFGKAKNELIDKLKIFIADQRGERGTIMKTFRSDNGTEFVNKDVKDLLKKHCIKFQTSAPYVHEQNGLVERDNRTLVELSRSMIHARGLPKKLWAEAMNTAAYVMNRVMNRKDLYAVREMVWEETRYITPQSIWDDSLCSSA